MAGTILVLLPVLFKRPYCVQMFAEISTTANVMNNWFIAFPLAS
jgi:hypothetical protein